MLAGISIAALRDACPDTTVFRLMPNTPLEARRACYPLTVGREVTSPGGTTARGFAALERDDVRTGDAGTAFPDATDAVIDGGPR